MTSALTNVAADAKVFEGSKTLLPQPCQLVIFGGPGDLSWRKLLPAIYNLDVDGVLLRTSRCLRSEYRRKAPPTPTPTSTSVRAPGAGSRASRARRSTRPIGRTSPAACSSVQGSFNDCAPTSN